jgi:hypothetical protein
MAMETQTEQTEQPVNGEEQKVQPVAGPVVVGKISMTGFDRYALLGVLSAIQVASEKDVETEELLFDAIELDWDYERMTAFREGLSKEDAEIMTDVTLDPTQLRMLISRCKDHVKRGCALAQARHLKRIRKMLKLALGEEAEE